MSLHWADEHVAASVRCKAVSHSMEIASSSPCSSSQRHVVLLTIKTKSQPVHCSKPEVFATLVSISLVNGPSGEVNAN